MNLGLPCSHSPLTCMPQADLTALLKHSTCLYQWSLLSFRMRSRSSMPNWASSFLDLMVTMSCGLTLQTCRIIVLSFCCRCWRFGFINGRVSLAWSIALHTRAEHAATCLKKRGGGKRELVAAPSSGGFPMCCG